MKSPRPALAATLAALVACMAVGPARAESAYGLNEEGNRAYRKAELEQALRAYTEAQVRDPDSPAIQYNIGNVFYRQQEYERASEAYRKSLQEARGPLARDAAYNFGNARFQAGDYAGAVEGYRGALEIDPSDRDAKRNLEIALARLKPPPPQSGGGKSDPKKDSQESKQEQARSGSEPQPDDTRKQPGSPSLDREEAERLLEALAQQEREALEQENRKAGQAVHAPGGKDW